MEAKQWRIQRPAPGSSPGLLDGDGRQPARDGLAAWRRRQRGRGGGGTAALDAGRGAAKGGGRTTRVQMDGAPAWSRLEGTDEPRTVATRESRVRCRRGRGCSVLGKAGAGTRVDVDFGMLG